MLVAVGAPSSLAVEVAEKFGATLIGFTKPNGFNIYTGAERVRFRFGKADRVTIDAVKNPRGPDMKLRLQSNSIRLRLKRGEVMQLIKDNIVEETIAFGKTRRSAIACRPFRTTCHMPHASFKAGRNPRRRAGGNGHSLGLKQRSRHRSNSTRRR